MSLIKAERETVVTMNDAEDTAEVWSAQRRVITKLHRAGAELVEEGKIEGTAWARFRMPARFLSFRTVR
jgi:hypothetical protein